MMMVSKSNQEFVNKLNQKFPADVKIEFFLPPKFHSFDKKKMTFVRGKGNLPNGGHYDPATGLYVKFGESAKFYINHLRAKGDIQRVLNNMFDVKDKSKHHLFAFINLESFFIRLVRYFDRNGYYSSTRPG